MVVQSVSERCLSQEAHLDSRITAIYHLAEGITKPKQAPRGEQNNSTWTLGVCNQMKDYAQEIP